MDAGDLTDPVLGEHYAAPVNEWLSALFEAGAEDAAEIVGQGGASGAAWAAEHGGEMLTRGSGTCPLDALREKVAKRLTEALEGGMSGEEFRRSIALDLEDDLPSRAGLIARTEAKNGYNHGAVEQYRAQDVERVQIADGSGLGDICDQENGEVVTLEEGLRRSDERHPNCTLALIPVLEGLGEGEEE